MKNLDLQFALNVLATMVEEEARASNQMMLAFPKDFERLNASTGAGIRLQALQDARQRIVVTAIHAYEESS